MIDAKRICGAISGAALAVAVTATNSLAALTAEQQAIVDATDTLISDMQGNAWKWVLAISGTLVMIGIFKKFLFRGTS